MGDSARRNAEKYGNLKLPKKVEVDRNKLTIGVSSKCIVGIPPELLDRFPEGRFYVSLRFVGKQIQFLLQPSPTGRFTFRPVAETGQHFCFITLNSIEGMGANFPKFGKTPVQSAIWDSFGLRLLLPAKLNPLIVKGKARRQLEKKAVKEVQQPPTQTHETVENTMTDRYDVPAEQISKMTAGLAKCLKIVMPEQIGKRFGDGGVQAIVTRQNGQYQITLSANPQSRARISQTHEGYTTSPSRNTVRAGAKWKFRRSVPQSARWQGDTLIITMPEGIKDPIVRRSYTRGSAKAAVAPKPAPTHAPEPARQPQGLRDVERETQVPAVSLRQAVRAINAFKDAEPDNLVLSIDKDGKLEAMVRYY